ncbi:MAG: phospholipase D-like domain-containing protein [Butyricicoccus sp.]|nr:phospholipase D-like domain-containing protein [Butyricicoccus sp.]
MFRSYYATLLQAGVKIYEYTPGFVHAKGCLIDGKVGIIGTVNLDYRSLFLHFENNIIFYRAPIPEAFQADFLQTQKQCEEKTLQNIGLSFHKLIVDGVLRILPHFVDLLDGTDALPFHDV